MVVTAIKGGAGLRAPSCATTCKMCPGTYIPIDELQAYLKKAIAERRTDQQVRDVAKKYGRKNPVYGRSGTAPAKNAPWRTHLDEIAGKFFDSTRRRSISTPLCELMRAVCSG
jgi:hypothetical protein